MNEIICICVALSLSFGLGDQNINIKCQKKLSSGRIEWYCCDNEEDINGTCVECKLGYQSHFGEICRKCAYGTYGRKCGDVCVCNEDERCDHVIGCVTLAVSTFMSTEQTRQTMLANKETTTEYTKQEDTVNGLLRRELVIYSVSAGGFIMLILCLTCVLKRKRKTIYDTPDEASHNGNTVVQHISVNIDDSSIEIADGIYETIDEANLIDFNFNSTETDLSSSSSDSNYDSPSIGQGYTNPYQTTVSDPQSHDYTIIHATKSDSESHLSQCSGYLNPYQPIVADIEIHAYVDLPKNSTYEKKENKTPYDLDARQISTGKTEAPTGNYSVFDSKYFECTTITKTIDKRLELKRGDNHCNHILTETETNRCITRSTFIITDVSDALVEPDFSKYSTI